MKAIFSLVFGIVSLICCWIPVLGVVVGPAAILLAVMVFRKGDAEGGKGLAIGGAVTGVLGVIASVVILAGLGLAMVQVRNWANTVGESITAAQAGDPSKLKGFIVPSSTVTDDQVAEFAQKVEAKLGKFQKPYGGLLEIIPVTAKFVTSDPARAERLRAAYNPVVYPAQFENGRGAVVLLVPAANGGRPDGTPLLGNVGVYQEGSTEVIWLVLPEP